MLGLYLLLAQNTIEGPLGGWGLLVIQGGALGLLAVLIIYILPKESESNRKERESRDAIQVKMIETLQERFEMRNSKIVDAIEKQTVVLQNSNNHLAEKVSAAVTQACRLIDKEHHNK
jgi:formiminotetrahydrofolate cyclodeaminase